MGRGGESRREDGPLEVYLKGKVVDVTKFARTHPGGAKVFRIFQNRDATEQFEMCAVPGPALPSARPCQVHVGETLTASRAICRYHSPVAHKKLDLMMKGARDAPKEAGVHTTPMGLDFQKLTKTLHAKGYFAPDYADEVFKLALTLLPGFLGARLFSAGTQCLGSFLIAFSFYLSGWTSHDYLHHGVFKGGHQKLVHFNNAIGYAIGTWQGYSVGWWRARHNTHHVCTNEIGNDPDIKTEPILVFVRNTRRIAEKLNAAQRWQQYYYVPVMAILDVYWRLESLAYLVMRPLAKTWLSWTLMGVHYATLYWVFQGQLGWIFFMSCCRGFMTGIVVFATHYGEDIIDSSHGMTLVEQTALTSRNITGGYLINILTGYISLQTEHHLWPMMPTAHLNKARPLCKAFFKKHGLKYRESNMLECVRFNIRALEFEHLLHA